MVLHLLLFSIISSNLNCNSNELWSGFQKKNDDYLQMTWSNMENRASYATTLKPHQYQSFSTIKLVFIFIFPRIFMKNQTYTQTIWQDRKLTNLERSNKDQHYWISVAMQCSMLIPIRLSILNALRLVISSTFTLRARFFRKRTNANRDWCHFKLLFELCTSKYDILSCDI